MSTVRARHTVVGALVMVVAIIFIALAAATFIAGVALYASGYDIGFLALIAALFFFTLAVGTRVVAVRQPRHGR